MKTVLHTNEKFWGKKMNLPGANGVEVGEDGTVELEDELAEMMTSGSPNDWKYPAGEEAEETVDADLQEILEKLDTMTLDELKEMCEATPAMGTQWKKFAKNDKALRTFMKNQLLKANKKQE